MMIRTTQPGRLQAILALLELHAQRRARSVLDGGYASVFRGRGTDFEDLREYVPGDPVADIDWKATARAGRPLVRRYQAERKTNLLLVVSTGRSMTALAPDGTTKAELALDVAGVFAALAVRHGDVVGAVFGDAAERCVIRPGGGRDHAEHVLRRLEDQANRANSAISSVPAVLERAAEARLPRGIVVLIADDADLPATAERSLSLLHARHQVMVAQIGDMAVGTDQAVNPYDVETGLEIPDEIWFDSDLRRAEARAGQTRAERIEHMFGSQGIARVSVNGRDDLVGALIRLFQRHRHGGT